ncbi:helix-turn-helix transcriptional regulator [Puniceicoccales bacterium CK1056]|uniref:Helix-turn-helix transcriptional regulator n=1 Tax=Oceanipulchritudo coccoides TaxID=2706888 RepID=A0A6B2LZS0_9BACT|nr:helix-turn-helix transcriptional regulator [Oceanipulchritudo coccoides]NDV62211.1 helix-turn-helix transcriptional regulator [Oceanipulchritudo coccoides]
MRISIRKGAKNVLGPALRRAREESKLRLTQSDLAEIISEMGLSIDRSAISRIENQERTLSDLEFLYFAAALRINPVRLFSLAYQDPSKLPAYRDFEAEEELQVAEEEDNADTLP